MTAPRPGREPFDLLGGAPPISPEPETTLGLAGREAMSLFDEFKTVASKGNVVDLAIGIVIGGAIHSIVDSLVKNLIMPLIAVVIPGERPGTHWQFTADGSTVHIGLLLADLVPLRPHGFDPLPLPGEVPGLAHAAQEGRGRRPRPRNCWPRSGTC